MPTVPRSRAGLLRFFGVRAASWAEHATALGLSESHAGELVAASDAARAADETKRALAQRARAATHAARLAEKRLRDLGGESIASIRAHAQATEDPAVLALAELPAPKDPTPTPAPPTPTNVRTHVDHEGAIVIAFDATRPRPHARAFTQVWRTLDGVGPFTLIGTTGNNEYRDSAVPQGTREAAYRLVPMRGTLVGEPAETVVVRLGTVAA